MGHPHLVSATCSSASMHSVLSSFGSATHQLLFVDSRKIQKSRFTHTMKQLLPASQSTFAITIVFLMSSRFSSKLFPSLKHFHRTVVTTYLPSLPSVHAAQSHKFCGFLKMELSWCEDKAERHCTLGVDTFPRTSRCTHTGTFVFIAELILRTHQRH